MRHFLHRLRHQNESKNPNRVIHLDQELPSDLKLHLKCLSKAKDGTSINLIIERQPTSIFVTDSCEAGIGYFSVKTGRAFRFEIPDHFRFRVSINVLECLALVVAIWFGILDREVSNESCSLAMSDNTSALG